jgi:hypothetical protein
MSRLSQEAPLMLGVGYFELCNSSPNCSCLIRRRYNSNEGFGTARD